MSVTIAAEVKRAAVKKHSTRHLLQNSHDPRGRAVALLIPSVSLDGSSTPTCS
jgi:hypothetical protein